MLAGRSQASETPNEACAGASDREWTRLAREQGSSKHVPRMALDVEVACAWKQSSDVAGSMSCIHVPAVKARATSARACLIDLVVTVSPRPSAARQLRTRQPPPAVLVL